MDRLPFGIGRLDSLIGGGAPAGSVVLLAGDPGAGAREFMYTSALMNALARQGSDRFELHYGELHPDAVVPDRIHYASFTTGAPHLESEMRISMDEDLVDDAVGTIRFADLSRSFFQLSPVPREWYAELAGTLEDLGSSRNRQTVFESLGEFLTENAAGNLVCIDSVTDLLSGMGDDFTIRDIATVLKGLQRISTEWGGLILLLLNRSTLTSQELGLLVDATDGTFVFEWERGGSELARTMVVTQFRGVLPQLEADDIVQFETEVTEGGFDISDVRKIR